MRRRKGFTLIELLVVVGVIALLLAVMAPVSRSVFARGDMLVCQSNLHQLGVAQQQYIPDHNGRFMPFRSWILGGWYTDIQGLQNGLMFPYIGKPDFFWCPTFRKVCDPAAVRTYTMTWNFGCTEPGWFGGTWGEGRSIDTLLQVKDPARLGICTEEATWTIPGYSCFTLNDAHTVAPDWPNRDSVANFHYPGAGPIDQQTVGKGNVCFVDGHVVGLTTDLSPYALSQCWYTDPNRQPPKPLPF